MNTNLYTSDQTYEAESQVHVRTLFLRYARYWPWFLLSLSLSLAAAYIYLLYQTPVYNIQASVLIKDEIKGISEKSLMKEMDVFKPSKVVENEVEILKSYTLMGRVVNNLGLTVRYYQPTRRVKKEIYNESPIRFLIEKPTPQVYTEEITISFIDSKTVNLNGLPYPVNQRIKTPFGQLRIFARKPLNNTLNPIHISVTPFTKTVEDYLGNLDIRSTMKQSTVLVMNLQDPVPDKGEAILNQLISEYNKESIVDKNEEASNTLDFIEGRLSLIAGELSTVEKQVESYKSTQGITDLGVQAETFLTAVKDNDTELSEATIRLGALADVERYIQNRSGQQGVAPATLEFNDPVLTGLLTRMVELELKREDLSGTTLPDNPLMQSLNSQLQNLKISVSDNIQTLRQQLVSSRNQLLANNKRMEGVIRTIPGKERALLNITRQQAIKNGLYTYLLQKREETALSAASKTLSSRTVDSAHTNSNPIKPGKMLIFAIFVCVGLLLPISIVSAKDRLNNHVLRRSDVVTATHIPILGEVVNSRQKGIDSLVFGPRMQSVIGEQIRGLRTNLHFLLKDSKKSQVLLFTSSISGEGKSFMALNLGASLALVNRKTVILEMDLRRPRLHTNLFIENRVGLSDYLTDSATIDEMIQPVCGYENYFIITAGPLPSNPTELLSSARMANLFGELRKRFDYILVDSPPIGLVTDSQLIAPFADATLFLVRHDHTPKNYINLVDSLYREQRFPKMSIILNGVGEGETFSYSYNYNHGDYLSLTKKD